MFEDRHLQGEVTREHLALRDKYAPIRLRHSMRRMAGTIFDTGEDIPDLNPEAVFALDNLEWFLGHIRPWHRYERGRYRAAAIPWHNRSAFLRQIISRFSKRLDRLPAGLHATTLKMDISVHGSPWEVAARLVMERDKKFEDIHHSTRGSITDRFLWSRYDLRENEQHRVFYVPGFFMRAGNWDHENAMLKIMQEADETERTARWIQYKSGMMP